MKIIFENKTTESCREIFYQTKRVQETGESVVPDVNDDIGKIASVQTAVYLKSKDCMGRGVLVTGEAQAAILYITEGEKTVSYLNVVKPFSIQFDSAELDADITAQVRLTVANCEARVLNPRKVSVSFELQAELSAYKKESLVVETTLPEEKIPGLHAKYSECDMVYINSVAEKTFTLSEQFTFPGGKPSPCQMVMPRISFAINDSQFIGSKIILKGIMSLTAAYISDEVNYPVKIDFSTPFSQIIDLGADEPDSCTVMIEISSVYYDIINTINGEKALDAEIHAVLQVVGRKKRRQLCISDVYSNLMPGRCTSGMTGIVDSAEQQSVRLVCEERIKVGEDCADVLSVFYSVSQLDIVSDKPGAAVALDIIYRTHTGTLSSVRRIMSMSGEWGKAPERLLGAGLSDAYLRPDGDCMDSHMVLELRCLAVQKREVMTVSAVELDEDEAYELSACPALTMVRAGKEELWDLAKQYRSSVDKIESVNDLAEGWEGRMLMIPRTI